MTRPNAYLGRTVDLLSALFLLLAITLGGQGPLTAQAAATPQSSTGVGDPGHRSKPFVTKQQFLVTEARDAKATPWDDGKAKKALLLSTGFEPEPLSAGLPGGYRLAGFVTRIGASGFQARAPPSQT